MKTFFLQKNSCGFSTIELLFAFAVATIFLSGAALISFGAQTTSLDMSLSRTGIVNTMTQLRNTLASTTQDWRTELSYVPGFYTESNTSNMVSPCLKKIESGVTWTTEHARGQYASFRTLTGSFEEARAYGGGCDPFPAGVWDTPDSLGSVPALDANPTALEVRSIAGDTYAFITANGAILEDNDLVVVDATDPSSPHVVGIPLNNFKGLNSIAVANSFAYVLQNSNTEQLVVLDIHDPIHPTEITSARRTLPYIVFSCSPVTEPCLSGKSVAYHNGRLYIGTSYIAFGSSGQNHELHVYCVDDAAISGCAPQTPVWLGSYNVNHNVNDIALQTQRVGGIDKTLAYLAVSASTAGASELLIFDVTVPSSISSVGAFNPSGTDYGQSIYLLGNFAYLGRNRSTGINKDLYVLDVSNPAVPIERSSKKLGLASNTFVSAIVVQGGVAFVATTDSSKPLLVFDVTDAVNLKPVSACAVSHAQITRDIAYHEDLVFTVNGSSDALRIFYDQSSSCI